MNDTLEKAKFEKAFLDLIKTYRGISEDDVERICLTVRAKDERFFVWSKGINKKIKSGQYEIVFFSYKEEDDYILKETVEKFLEDAEFVILNCAIAFKKEFINGVGDSLRGATLQYADGNMDFAYNIESKLVLKK